MTGHGAMDEGEAQAAREKAWRPIDEDPLFIQVKTQFEERGQEVSRLRGENKDLEAKNRLLEKENERLSKLVLSKVLTVVRITGDEELAKKSPQRVLPRTGGTNGHRTR